MKKVMIAFAAIAMAFAANAATISWSVTKLYEVDSTTTLAAGYTAYLFVSAQTGTEWGTVVSKEDVVASILDGSFMNNYSGLSVANATSINGAIVKAGMGPNGGFAAGDSTTAFTVIFDANTVAAAKHYSVSATDATVAYTSASGSKALGFANYSANNTWADIAPEPTSGLLMLLGMGALALRRRRA